MKEWVVKGIEVESTQVSYLDDLHKIKCPALVIRGELEESLLSKDEICLYINYLGSKSIRVENFENCGHDI